MTSIQDCAAQRCTLSGINLALRRLDSGSSPRNPAPVLGQHDRDAAAGLSCRDAEVGALAHGSVLRAGATR